MEKPFLILDSDEGHFFINIQQIVRVDIAAGDEITLNTSDGRSNTLHGEAVQKVIDILTNYAIDINQKPVGR